MNEADELPLRYKRCLAGDHQVEESAVLVRGVNRLWVMPRKVPTRKWLDATPRRSRHCAGSHPNPRVPRRTMARNGADFNLVFRRLCDAAASPDGDASVRSLFTDPSSFDDWAARWRHRLAAEGGEANERRAAMRAANPAFMPRNHLVEEAISAAVNDGNFLPFEGLLTVLSMPYEDQPGFGRYIDPPRPDQVVQQTFCGT